uniref:Peptidase aspartic putative domain-containing protein n=1 Tax=Stomoxys calcitrans TaxID=35570 RepID=A0A1I8PEN8_STOCA
MERPADDFRPVHDVRPASNARHAPIASPPFRWDLVFVPTAMVRIAEDGVDTWATIRALVNQSSTMSRIAYSTFRRLDLRSFTYQGNRFTTFRVMHRNQNSTWALKINALITEALPFRPYSDPLLDDPTRDLAQDTLADPDPRANTSVDLELGGDVYPRLQRDGHVFSGIGDVNAFQTTLGYVFVGSIRNMPRH